uniref:LRRNT domain-containing protein n=1 Tax=Biomphalaria glabrata TaxID=6526 RepID=A0A2C9L6W4_BIOGL
MHRIWILRCFMLFVTSKCETPVCPLQCKCHLRQDRYIIDCNAKNLTTLPFLCAFENDESHKKVDLHANGNNFRYVLKNSLYHLRNRLVHLEITSNSFSIELARYAFDGFAETLETLKLEPIAADVNALIDSLRKLTGLRVLHLTSVTEELQILSARLSFPALSELRLQKCRLQNITNGVFKSVPLKVLNLNNNHMTHIPQELVRAISKSITILHMSANKITEITDSDISTDCRLIFIDLSYNRITSIEEGVLDRCAYLRYFNVSHNPNLFSLGNAVFDGLISLHLDISHTPISNLNFVKKDVLVDLIAFDTSLRCSCDVQVRRLEALQGHLKGTCFFRDNVVFIQSYPLECSRYKNRQKRVRFSLDTQAVNPERNFDLETSIVTQKSWRESRQNLLEQASIDTKEARSVYSTLTRATEADSIITPTLSICNKCKSSSIALYQSSEVEASRILDFPSSETSHFVWHSPYNNEPPPTGEANTWSSQELYDIDLNMPEKEIPNLKLPALGIPNVDLSKYTTLTVGSTDSEGPKPLMSASSTLKDKHELALQSTSIHIPESSKLAKEDATKIVVEKSKATPVLPNFKKSQTVLETLSTSFENTEITYHAPKNNERSTQSMCLPTTSEQTATSCHWSDDRTIKPSATINIINQISSTITYRRDYTYFIKHVENLNPQFCGTNSLFLKLSPTPVSPETPRPHDIVTVDVSRPSDTKHKAYSESQERRKVTSAEKEHQKILISNEDHEAALDTPSAEIMKWFLECPLSILVCWVHACLIFLLFLRIDHSPKMKNVLDA